MSAGKKPPPGAAAHGPRREFDVAGIGKRHSWTTTLGLTESVRVSSRGVNVPSPNAADALIAHRYA